jgi:hypothetical protein
VPLLRRRLSLRGLVGHEEESLYESPQQYKAYTREDAGRWSAEVGGLHNNSPDCTFIRFAESLSVQSSSVESVNFLPSALSLTRKLSKG